MTGRLVRSTTRRRSLRASASLLTTLTAVEALSNYTPALDESRVRRPDPASRVPCPANPAVQYDQLALGVVELAQEDRCLLGPPGRRLPRTVVLSGTSKRAGPKRGMLTL